jgi:hypothetical protein
VIISAGKVRSVTLTLGVSLISTLQTWLASESNPRLISIPGTVLRFFLHAVVV